MRLVALVLLAIVPFLCGWTHTITFESDGASTSCETGSADSFMTYSHSGTQDAARERVSTAAHEGTYSCKVSFAACQGTNGYVGSDGPDLRVDIEDLAANADLWIRGYFLLSPDFEFAYTLPCDGSSFVKVFRTWYDTNNGSYAGFVGSNGVATFMGESPTYSPRLDDTFSWEDATPEWHCFEYVMLNFLQADETHYVIIDGTVKITKIRQTTTATGITLIKILDTVNTGFSNTQELWIDDVIITNDLPANTCDGVPCIGLDSRPVEAGCTGNADCNDQNICTTDTCTEGTCSNANNTEACDDGIYCNGTDTCQGGACAVHSNNVCTGRTTCNEATGNCESRNAIDLFIGWFL